MGNRLTTGQKNSYSFEQHRSLTVTQRQNFGNRELERNWTDLNVVRWRSHFQSTDVTTEPETNSNNTTAEQEKCYDPKDTTLIFVDGEDDHDFERNDFKSLRAKMSCGHTVTPMSLTNWCKHLLSQGEIGFVCGQPDCNVEWTYDEVWKMALLTPEEMEYFDKKMFSRAAKEFLDFKSCPGCKCSVVRSDVNNLRVCCVMCTAKTNVAFSFCWQCLEEWKGPSPYPDRCANEGCINKQQEILNTCPDITFESVRGVAGCPSVRVCPTCGLLLEHNRTKCKNMRCPRCKVEFCFVCLKLTEECLAQEKSSHYLCCPSGVAPRQTTIPVWQRK
ncbi:E3 ubiquitin-protein ligase ARIH2-like isoform X2 [Eleginops maclovinus]|uniref:E3 ubiquitin-protein ligase ARIH2-like isoform X2 n=1 Tax=Eleginops maclovinus TaxID=56733 RepID=UPI0030807726